MPHGAEVSNFMRVLVTWGSKLGGTAGIGEILAEKLRRAGFEVVARPAKEVRDLREFNAVLVGGALYANLWHRDARRFVDRHEAALRRLPVWFFSSGPLDDSAERGEEIPPTRQVRALMDRVGALGHATFGGRLSADTKGFPAEAMAKEHAGDWRNPARIGAWAEGIARGLPEAQPGTPVPVPGRSWARLVAYAALGWILCAAVMFGLLAVFSPGVATVVHAIAAPLIFIFISMRYFRPSGAREPVAAALAFTAIAALLDAIVVAALIQGSPALLLSITGFWLPLGLIFIASWVTGWIMSMGPMSEMSPPQSGKPLPSAPPARA